MEPYARLLELALRERELIQAGRYDALAELGAARAETAAALPAQAPLEAAPLLERTLELVRANEASLDAALAAARAELAHLDHARVTITAYTRA
jgi:hypothetical protein